MQADVERAISQAELATSQTQQDMEDWISGQCLEMGTSPRIGKYNTSMWVAVGFALGGLQMQRWIRIVFCLP